MLILLLCSKNRLTHTIQETSSTCVIICSHLCLYLSIYLSAMSQGSPSLRLPHTVHDVRGVGDARRSTGDGSNQWASNNYPGGPNYVSQQSRATDSTAGSRGPMGPTATSSALARMKSSGTASGVEPIIMQINQGQSSTSNQPPSPIHRPWKVRQANAAARKARAEDSRSSQSTVSSTYQQGNYTARGGRSQSQGMMYGGQTTIATAPEASSPPSSLPHHPHPHPLNADAPEFQSSTTFPHPSTSGVSMTSPRNTTGRSGGNGGYHKVSGHRSHPKGGSLQVSLDSIASYLTLVDMSLFIFN